MDEPVRDDAAHLKNLREAAGLDMHALAAKSNLSVAQIRQLEEGGETLFYSPQIKQQAMRRVIRLLETPESPDAQEPVQPERSHHTGTQVIDNIIRLSEQNLKSHLVTSAVRRPGASPAKMFLLAAVVLVLLGLMAWQFQRHESQALYSEWVEPVTANVLAQPEQVAPPSAAVAVTTEQVQPPVVEAVQAVTPPPPPVPEKPVDPAPVPVAAAETTANKDCQQFTAEPVAIATTIHNKPGNYVHLFSNKALQVCVDDGKNKRTVVKLSPGVGRSVVGVSPWTLSSNDLKSVQIYFQGGKVLLPPDAGTRIYLKEQAVSP